jgi:outer membrane protein TolC
VSARQAIRALCATVLVLAAGGSAATAQLPAPTLPRVPAPVAPVRDSMAALTFSTFYAQVLAAHPVARQARLARDQAREELRIARGAFDPTLSASLDQKTFGGTQYFNYVEAELKVPTPVGSDVKLSYERAAGTYIARDRQTPASGLLKLGLSLPVGQRVLTDERRNALVQARALQSVAEADQRAALNKLLQQAAKDYATWYEADRRRAVAYEGVALAEFRLRAVRARVGRGEAAPIDTVEALLEVQRRTVQRYEAEQAYYGASLDVANHLWEAGTDASEARPMELAAGTVPSVQGLEAERVDSTQLPAWLQAAARRHPEVLKIAARVDQARAQRMFVMQQAIPFAELSLNALAPQTDARGLGRRGQVDNNYAVGGSVRSPLLFLKERGRFAMADQRLDQQTLEQARVGRVVELEVRQAVNDLATTYAVLELQRAAVRQARQLLAGEQRRFENGESQLLVVNLRERLVLDEALKLASLEAKYVASRAALAVALGQPGVP